MKVGKTQWNLKRKARENVSPAIDTLNEILKLGVMNFVVFHL